MNPEFWNQRFADEGFVYGTTPNVFVKEQIWRLPAKASVIELGCGEGRNAVFLATRGFEVTAVDYSIVGIGKLQRLARQYNVTVKTICADVLQWSASSRWDAVIVTFLHLPPLQRPLLYERIQQSLVPGGYCIAEWFRPEQRLNGYTSGGPPSPELMVSADELRQHFAPAGILLLQEMIRELDEGPGHRGPAAVVQLVWQKPLSHSVSDHTESGQDEALSLRDG